MWAASPGAGYTGQAISKYTTTGTKGTGYPLVGSSVYSGPYAIAIDGSGDVWTVNAGNNTLVEMIGSAAPVVTPLAANLIGPYFKTASLP